jgi:DNA-binding transcriptional LysR family regulator
MFARNGVQPEIVFRAASNETVLSMVRAGIGSAVLPQLALHTADAATDALRRIGSGAAVDFSPIHLLDERLRSEHPFV